MANYIASDTDLTAVANAIRTKGGTSAQLAFPAGFVSAIGAITTGDAIDHEDLPSYVKAEALEVAKRVKAHLQADSIIALVGSDAHQREDYANIVNGNLHAGMAMKALSYVLPLDFAAYLGDYTVGSSTTTIAEGLAHFNEINADIDEAFRGLPQFRTVGNHDPLGYSKSQNGTALTPEQLYSYIGKYNDDGVTVMGSTTAGYCYRDFSAKSLRVICLNTADTTGTSGDGEIVTDAQKKWFADTLISTPQDYGILILAHHPLDWGNIISTSGILRAYVEEQSGINIGGTTYDFSGKNKSAWVFQIHGHTHCFKVDNLHYNDGGTGVPYDVKRVATPNMCFLRNNEYGQNGAAEYYGIEFGETVTYNKTANSGKDTAFCVYVINPSEEKVYAICYGAGYDREVYWGTVVIPVTGISLSAASGTLNPGASISLSTTITPANATNKTVIWTSSNSSVATVNNGTITAVAIGSATITATTQDGGFTASYALTVEAPKRGNLIPEIGYDDNKRIKVSTGLLDTASGYVATGYIDLQDQGDTVVIRTNGVDFDTSRYGNAAYYFYTDDTNKTPSYGGYLTSGDQAWGSMNMNKAHDSSGNLTITLTGASRYTGAGGSYRYIRICGYGSGANLDLRLNETFD